jgi:hypothetical protein
MRSERQALLPHPSSIIHHLSIQPLLFQPEGELALADVDNASGL